MNSRCTAKAAHHEHDEENGADDEADGLALDEQVQRLPALGPLAHRLIVHVRAVGAKHGHEGHEEEEGKDEADKHGDRDDAGKLIEYKELREEERHAGEHRAYGARDHRHAHRHHRLPARARRVTGRVVGCLLSESVPWTRKST